MLLGKETRFISAASIDLPPHTNDCTFIHITLNSVSGDQSKEQDRIRQIKSAVKVKENVVVNIATFWIATSNLM